jgi:NAD-dependent SIR2 family protein deacetylase
MWFKNIDMLEFESGMSEDKIITAHGSHHTSTCLSCKKKYDYHWMNG